MAKKRRKCADGFGRRLRGFFLGNFKPFWDLVSKIPWLNSKINAFIINTAANATRNRPHPLSTLSDYTSWDSLTDTSYFGRHLEPLVEATARPDIEKVVGAFERPTNTALECSKSTLLFPVFAQYLTDGFLRTNMDERSKTTSNHNIDLSPLYGRTRAQTYALRLRDNTRANRGRLRSQLIDGQEYPEGLFEDDGVTIREPFLGADGQPILDPPLGFSNFAGQGHERRILAVGGDRANATPMITLMNTLFLREHNRVAGELTKLNDWDDERVFQTARNIVIVMYIKLVIEDYINHISSACFQLKADPSVSWDAIWNRPPWMTVEFALLYRWHPLIPNSVTWNGIQVPADQMVLDNRLAFSRGVVGGFLDMSTNNANKLSLLNTPDFLLRVEREAINQSRSLRVPKFNAYREMMGMPPITDFREMTGDPDKLSVLRDLYDSPDETEFYVGLFAEDTNPNTPMPSVMGAMVALDAFTQALTNPLLSQHVYSQEETFTKWGLDEIQRTKSVGELVRRHAQGSDIEFRARDVTMTRPDWKRTMVGI